MESEKLSWIKVSSGSPFFIDEKGNDWTPIGQNDAIIWPDLAGLFQRKDVKAVENHLEFLAAHGVTCMRVMLEYCQTENRYLERPAGRFQPNMVQFWDDLFLLCEKYKLRLLLTPYDTFWMSRRWKSHPYNAVHGGPCKTKSHWLTSPAMMNAIKSRLTFATERWGSSGVIFGWDLWNEINPAHASKKTDGFYVFIDQVSDHLRSLEMRLFGKSHLQTVSIFAPLLRKYSVADVIFGHPKLDFASTHFYEAKTISYPRNTFDAASATGKMVREALLSLSDQRPFLDSEHGPIDYFKMRKKNLAEEFDDQYFLNMQWAHIASGGAGGGMRWPYRHPHTLTHGMRMAQRNLSDFILLIDWKNFKRENLNEEIIVSDPAFAVFGCGDEKQAIVWLVRKQQTKKRVIGQKEAVKTPAILIPNLRAGLFRIHGWNTVTGMSYTFKAKKGEENLEVILTGLSNNMALAIVWEEAEY